MEENKYKRVEDIILKRSKHAGHTGLSTKYKGVRLDKRYSKLRFESRFEISNGMSKKVQISLGTYDTPEEAYIARLKFIDSLK